MIRLSIMAFLEGSSWNTVALIPLVLFVISCFFESNDPVRFFAKYALYVIYSSSIAVLMLPYTLLSPKNVRNSRDGAFFMRYYTKLLGIEWDIRGKEELGKERGCIVVANHQSILDVLAVARRAVFYVFPFGPMAWLAGVVFIRRGDRGKSMETLLDTSELIKNQATKLFIFPEGSRNKDILKNGLGLFRRGAFRLAIHNQVPILPIVYSPYYFIDSETRFFGHGKMIVKTLEPIPTVGLEEKDLDDLKERTRTIMQEEFDKLAIEVLAALPKDYPANVASRNHFEKSKNVAKSL
ncbi:1-acyl-sn-glycerol-3-phosphate acyltransferase beta-like isoform X2 [Venturia canescens]|uniref:1-acyl-sn-glycerol-3-phosphate acyltransferase beta-like isoform X2 n=1 Tax=Venturia canescens TaxID=32260 RepID=UPI001C9D1AA1|nr:1-acyl-sn-glycerol-3-phosphate acyltransferase beta-like isoform X2 [Venturia canescens]